MRLHDFAKKHNITYKTALIWFHDGKIPNSYQLDTGTILVEEPTLISPVKPNVCVYARVSNTSRRKELDYQVQRCLDFAAARGLSVDKIYKEVASGMNDSRKQLWKMLDSQPTTIVVEHKDRLTRFGFNYLDQLLPRLGCELIVINRDAIDENDLMKDLVSIITSFCCRLYGLRRGHNKAKIIRKELEA